MRERKEITDYKDYGNGVKGPSRRDQIRANLTYGRDLLRGFSEDEEGRSAVITALLAVATAIGVGAGGFVIAQGMNRGESSQSPVAAETASPTPATTATPKPSEAPGTPTPTKTPEVKTQQTTDAEVPLERKWVKGQEEEVAKLHGKAGTYSGKASSWEIDAQGGAMLKPNPDGSVSRIDTGTAALETWLAVKEDPNITKFNAEGFIVPAHVVMAIQGGTFWEFGEANNAAGVRQLDRQFRDKELGTATRQAEQPGIAIVNVCPPPTPLPSAK